MQGEPASCHTFYNDMPVILVYDMSHEQSIRNINADLLPAVTVRDRNNGQSGIRIYRLS